MLLISSHYRTLYVCALVLVAGSQDRIIVRITKRPEFVVFFADARLRLSVLRTLGDFPYSTTVVFQASLELGIIG